MDTQEARKPGRPRNADTVKTNADVETPQDPVLEKNEELQEENIQLRETIQMMSERIARIEAVQSKAKLRKYDEENDPNALKHTGRVLSQDGKDPILWLKRTGGVVQIGSGNTAVHKDEQTLFGKTLSGQDVTFTFESLVSRCSGNSIPCQINNWSEWRAKEQELYDLRSKYQRANGKTAKANTVELKQRIKELEENIRMSVTLSLDDGKSYTGETCEIHPTSVLNALP